jgi:hypothetical protein
MATYLRGMRAKCVYLSAVLVCGITSALNAAQFTTLNQPIPLTSLAGTGNSILVGDKVFDNFSYSNTGDMPAVSQVNITPMITTIAGQTVWGFQVEGLFTDSSAAGGSDAVLNYRVTVTDPSAFMISDAHLSGDTDVIGTGFVKVTETWTPNAGAEKIRIYDIQPGGLTQLSDAIDFDVPASSLDVSKNIAASIADGSTGSNATVTSINQFYSQTPGTGGGTPEPATLSVLGLGGLVVLGRRRK